MGITFQRTGRRRLAVNAMGTLLGIAMTSALAALFTDTEAAAMAWATVPVAGLAGWRLADLPLGPDRTRQVLKAAVAFGGLVAFGGVLLSTLVAMLTALLPGSTASRAEGPFGYVIFLTIALASLTPVLAVPATVVGLIWAALMRRLGGAPTDRPLDV